MMKKIRLFLLSLIVIFGIGMSYADVIDPNQHYVDRCVKLQNVEIDNYRVIVENDTVTYRDVYEPQAGNCLEQHYKFGESRQYLLDKSIDIEEITKENIHDKAIQIGDLRVNGRYVDNGSPLSDENLTYKIVKNGNDYILEESDGKSVKASEDGNNYSLEIVESEQGIELVSADRLIKFGIAWIITILIETIVLFLIAKLFRKEDQIPNGRLILIGILASTITLPLLRFVLPMFIVYGVEYVVIGELLVTIIEIFIIKYGLRVSRGKAILLSVVCNLCSYLLGLFVF